MKQNKLFAHYYVNLLVKLGLVRFSLFLAIVLVALAVFIQVSINFVLNGNVQLSEIIRSVFFGLLITPGAIYIFSVVVDQLEESRQRLTKLVSKLERMRVRDMELNTELTTNITRLNLEIEERQRAEEARKKAINDLRNEIKQREKVQLDLAEQTSLFRSIIDASPDLIYYRNEKGEFGGCNKAMEELTGKVEKDLVGLTPKDIYSPEIAKKIIETDQEVFENNTILIYEQWMEYKDGRKAYFDLRKLPFYSHDGKRLGLVGFGRESTERKRVQDALEKASRDKTAFISTISHELKTPLNGIVGLSRMLLESKLNKEQLGYLRTIHVSAITLGSIFNDIIDLDKSDRSRLELFPLPLNLFDFVSEIENISALMASQKGLRFSLERLDSLPTTIKVDGTRLRQILWNLVGNAVKFTKSGVVNVTVGCEVKSEIAYLQFDIEDSGIGIPEQELNNIFTMYYQVKQGEDNLHAVGTGIGLAVSRQLARLMGGDIYVESEIGEGSTFSFTLPAAICDTQELRATPRITDKPLHIMLVEDIELNIVVARNLLVSLGHTVSVARSGKEALALFREGLFDLLLLDIQLPDMTGFDIAETLRKREENLPPLVALTANIIADKNDYLEKGLDDAISKPINVSIINEVIESLKVRAFQKKEPDQKVTATQAPQDALSQNLDLEILTSYAEMIGIEEIEKSLILFEDLMLEYLACLDKTMEQRDQKGTASEAHKIKGAASAIGLRRTHLIAQKMDFIDKPYCWESIEQSVLEMKQKYLDDIVLLRSWLNEKKNQS